MAYIRDIRRHQEARLITDHLKDKVREHQERPQYPNWPFRSRKGPGLEGEVAVWSWGTENRPCCLRGACGKDRWAGYSGTLGGLGGSYLVA